MNHAEFAADERRERQAEQDRLDRITNAHNDRLRQIQNQTEAAQNAVGQLQRAL